MKRQHRNGTSDAKSGKGASVPTPGMIVGAAAVAAAVAGVYLFTGKRGKKNREQVSEWAVKAKEEVLERVEKVKEIDFASYVGIVDTVLKRYRSVKDVTKAEVDAIAKELRGVWDTVGGDTKKTVKKPASKSSGTAKKTPASGTRRPSSASKA